MTMTSKGAVAAAAGLLTTLALAGCADVSAEPGGAASGSAGAAGSTVAFLMPDTGSTRYELHDRPGFENRLKELCADCKPLYNNADASV